MSNEINDYDLEKHRQMMRGESELDEIECPMCGDLVCENDMRECKRCGIIACYDCVNADICRECISEIME